MKSKTFRVERDRSLDFAGEVYASAYPNLHRYPATMIPQLGMELLSRLGLTKGKLLDPYCGSGSSFAAAISSGFKSVEGYDLNPLAVLISKVKCTFIEKETVLSEVAALEKSIAKLNSKSLGVTDLPKITNIDYWFPQEGTEKLALIKRLIDGVDRQDVRDLFLLAFSESVRDVSYTRKNEFKLYRIPPEKVALHKPAVDTIFLDHLNRICDAYLLRYQPMLKGVRSSFKNENYSGSRSKVDVVLTSPPYGDSRTTVAYGQFSTLTNEWLGISDARKIDGYLMGGRRVRTLISESCISPQVRQVFDQDEKRGFEVSSFYDDLRASISEIGRAIKSGGYAIYIVGNRRVKDVQLETDQFIAEQFCRHGFDHELTLERAISSKSMPAVNSPSNKAGVTRGTMTQEFIVICRKR